MGILDYVKGILRDRETDSLKQYAVSHLSDERFNHITDSAYAEIGNSGLAYYANAKSFATYANDVLILTDKEKVAFIIYGYYYNDTVSKQNNYWQDARLFNSHYIVRNFVAQLLRAKLVLEEEDAIVLANTFTKFKELSFGIFLTQVQKQFQGKSISQEFKEAFTTLSNAISKSAHNEKDKQKQLNLLHVITENNIDADSNVVHPYLLSDKDGFGIMVNTTIKNTPNEEQAIWYQLATLAAGTTGSKPTVKFNKTAAALVAKLGQEAFLKQVHQWIDFLVELKDVSAPVSYVYNGQTHTNENISYLNPSNADVLKGIVWMLVPYNDKTTLYQISRLAMRAFKKIPNVGPAAQAVGNACIYVLAESGTMDGINHLSALKLKVKHAVALKLIDNYLTATATATGISNDEIEDMAVMAFGFQNGRARYEIDGYSCVVEIASTNKVVSNWYKADGSTQKSVPTAVKEHYKDEYKQLTTTLKIIEQSLVTQRDRLDRMMKRNRKMTGAHFTKYLFGHGIICAISQKLVWRFETDNMVANALWVDGIWIDAESEQVFPEFNNASVSLWHPVNSTAAEVNQWRNLLMDKNIEQPFKQVFREVYLLTEAEVNTSTYSNRMAAHILRQHQFNVLAKTRGWRYSLQGGFDNGDNGRCVIDLTFCNLYAEFWVNTPHNGDMLESGIYKYVFTDQVRFTNPQTFGAVILNEIPAVVFSEVMRDVDLFVGVASVGNDPTWIDSGENMFGNPYWQSYSFGELTEVAKTRKDIIRRLLPRLKIAKVAHLEGNYLVVAGTLRTYKIHIGSTNILMSPNDQYLCIVPDRSKTKTEGVFLPFEGDVGLSELLSKAFLLATDDKITDKSITSQINRA